MQRNEQQEKFIQGIKTIRDYWLSLPDKTAEEIVDGVLFSTFVMFAHWRSSTGKQMSESIAVICTSYISRRP